MVQQKKQNITSVVKTYGNRLFRFIRSRVPTAADAEDILQEVWFQFSKVVDTEPIEQVSGWLFRVARNRITDNYRKRKDELLEDFTFETPKTSQYANILQNLEVADRRTLLVTGDLDHSLVLSSRNLQKATVTRAEDLNTYDILNAQTLIISEGAVEKIKETFA